MIKTRQLCWASSATAWRPDIWREHDPDSVDTLDIATAASLILLDAALTILLKLRLHWQIAIAAARMVLQLVAIGYFASLHFFPEQRRSHTAPHSRDGARRRARGRRPPGTPAHGPDEFRHRLRQCRLCNLRYGLALTTAIRPQPWFDPHYAIPLAAIILGSVLNSASLALDSFLGSVRLERPAIEARLSLGQTYGEAIAPMVRDAIRRGLLPIINQMSAAGIVTLPGIMTGQILAGSTRSKPSNTRSC
jgi:putative ABC transport system permease protein